MSIQLNLDEVKKALDVLLDDARQVREAPGRNGLPLPPDFWEEHRKHVVFASEQRETLRRWTQFQNLVLITPAPQRLDATGVSGEVGKISDDDRPPLTITLDDEHRAEALQAKADYNDERNASGFGESQEAHRLVRAINQQGEGNA